MNGFQRKIINKALLYIDRLDDWEREFIEDIDQRVDADEDYEPSEKQNHALNKIQQKLSRY